MKRLNEILVSSEITILHAIEQLDSGALQILLVVDDSSKLGVQ